MSNQDDLLLRVDNCQVCPFRPDLPKSIKLSEEYLAVIYEYLSNGTNHICHSTNKHICKGGRDWQLQYFKSCGFIEEATNESLFKAMRAKGIEPTYTEVDISTTTKRKEIKMSRPTNLPKFRFYSLSDSFKSTVDRLFTKLETLNEEEKQKELENFKDVPGIEVMDNVLTEEFPVTTITFVYHTGTKTKPVKYEDINILPEYAYREGFYLFPRYRLSARKYSGEVAKYKVFAYYKGKWFSFINYEPASVDYPQPEQQMMDKLKSLPTKLLSRKAKSIINYWDNYTRQIHINRKLVIFMRQILESKI